MIELGAGLNPDLTGRQNILNMARLLTLGAEYARTQMEEIRAFADIGDFFDRPVRVYSSGMRVRLTFAMFACFKPDVLIVDEALSVGDVFFQQKCAARIRELLSGGMTMVFVSHDTAAVLNLCDRALLLRGGAPVFLGDPKEAVSRYYTGRTGSGNVTPPAKWRHEVAAPDENIGSTAEEILAHDVIGRRRHRSHGHKGISILGARVIDAGGHDTRTFRVGEQMVVLVLLEAARDVAHPRAGLRLFDRLDNQIFGGGTAQVSRHLPPMRTGDRLIVRFELTLDIRPGPYSFGLGTSEPDHSEGPNGAVFHDSIDALGPIDVAPPDSGRLPFFGMANLPLEVRYRALTTDGETPGPGDA
jgi:energy-coupling factor transporter ATP-binding protein EcfA2